MAGYLGTKAVLLSTTAADVVGNAEIGGDLTVGGNITSTGIDDNASSTAITIDSSQNVGIGTSSPDAPLTIENPSVSGDQNILTIQQNGAGTTTLAKVTYNQTDDSLKFINASTYSGSHMDFWTNNTERMRIDSSGRVTMPYQPAFRAHTFTPMSGVGTIVYTVAAHNIGSHYNTSTGRFTAPVAGVYHFDFSVLMYADNSTHYVRVLFAINGVRNETRNGETLTGGVAGAFTDYNYHAVQTSHSFYLSANDTVEVSAENPNGQTYQSSGSYGSFSGYLIG